MKEVLIVAGRLELYVALVKLLVITFARNLLGYKVSFDLDHVEGSELNEEVV